MNSGEARRRLAGQSYDLAVINTPLRDEFGNDLACRIAETTLAGVVLLVKAEHAAQIGVEALNRGASIVTDTQMAASGINKKRMRECGGEVYCFMSDPDVAAEAKERGCTRAAVCMERAAALQKPLIIAVGNAPTALIRLYELIQEGKIKPELIIGAPVGFVNVVEAKELIMTAGIPYIVPRGRKGGSNIAATICNAMLYQGGR